MLTYATLQAIVAEYNRRMFSSVLPEPLFIGRIKHKLSNMCYGEVFLSLHEFMSFVDFWRDEPTALQDYPETSRQHPNLVLLDTALKIWKPQFETKGAYHITAYNLFDFLKQNPGIVTTPTAPDEYVLNNPNADLGYALKCLGYLKEKGLLGYASKVLQHLPNIEHINSVLYSIGSSVYTQSSGDVDDNTIIGGKDTLQKLLDLLALPDKEKNLTALIATLKVLSHQKPFGDYGHRVRALFKNLKDIQKIHASLVDDPAKSVLEENSGAQNKPETCSRGVQTIETMSIWGGIMAAGSDGKSTDGNNSAVVPSVAEKKSL